MQSKTLTWYLGWGSTNFRSNYLDQTEPYKYNCEMQNAIILNKPVRVFFFLKVFGQNALNDEELPNVIIN